MKKLVVQGLESQESLARLILGASLTSEALEACDADTLAKRFRYGELKNESAATVTEARRLAVLRPGKVLAWRALATAVARSEKPRVLTWSVAKKQLTVQYTQESASWGRKEMAGR